MIAFSLFIGALITLFQLSYWQVERLEWKNEVIERLDAEYQKDPKQHQFNFAALQALQAEELPIRYGQVSGKFIYDKEILVGPKTYEGDIGYHVVTPFELNDSGYILVNRGWVKDTLKDNIKKRSSNENVIVQGIFRKTDWNKFTPNNSPENNIWMKLDLKEIAQVKELSPVAPVMLFASDVSHDIAPIILQDTTWYPRNKHQQYAIFWATMGLALIAVFGLVLLKSRKS